MSACRCRSQLRLDSPGLSRSEEPEKGRECGSLAYQAFPSLPVNLLSPFTTASGFSRRRRLMRRLPRERKKRLLSLELSKVPSRVSYLQSKAQFSRGNAAEISYAPTRDTIAIRYHNANTLQSTPEVSKEQLRSRAIRYPVPECRTERPDSSPGAGVHRLIQPDLSGNAKHSTVTATH